MWMIRCAIKNRGKKKKTKNSRNGRNNYQLLWKLSSGRNKKWGGEIMIYHSGLGQAWKDLQGGIRST